MNAVEIEEAVSNLAAAPFDAATFPWAFLEAFGNKETTIKRLKSLKKDTTNQSDCGGVLQRNNIHMKVCAPGEVSAALTALRESPATTKHKAKFILATDGLELQAENLGDDLPPLVCTYPDWPNHFGFFLPLAGITTVKQVSENAFDIRATGRLNKLYVELLKHNPAWDTDARRQDLNHFFARLIFCFFAEDTNIFSDAGLFTGTLEKMTTRDGSNTHEVLAELFRAMNTKHTDRAAAKIKSWAEPFPYVNGELFAGSTETPKFNQIARTYLLFVGGLDWTKINPDIFGSMIQAVADDEERGELGMHYTSVPNILKVLNPLFLDDLRNTLEEAENNGRKLLNLRNRIARIRVFDPACGSGNFLVIAYKHMREIEAEINRRRGEEGRRSDIKLTNFRGIEIRHFSCEIARLALIIAEFQCDVLYRGHQMALKDFLPLNAANWITCGNALRLDWLKVCPPTEAGLKTTENALFDTPKEQPELDFEQPEGETYICGNPPYKGNARKSNEQKAELEHLFDGIIEKWGLLDYVCAWFFKSFKYSQLTSAKFAFVATNSVAQGQHISNFWRPLFDNGLGFFFAVRSFKWSNLAANDAGVTVVIIGAMLNAKNGIIFDSERQAHAPNINAYLLPQENRWVESNSKPISNIPAMIKGNYYGLSEHLLMNHSDYIAYASNPTLVRLIKKFYGSTEVINAKPRYCFWFESQPDDDILATDDIRERLRNGKESRKKSSDAVKNGMVNRPHQFREMNCCNHNMIAVPVVSSENRSYLPVELLGRDCVISNKCFALYDAPLWNLALIASRIHLIWIATVCVRMRMDFSYSNTLGWNTFPVPPLSEQNKADLTKCAEDILLAREEHFPATIADLYNPETMPDNLRAAHDRNDETLERIYIGRRFKNDTERLEKLFEMYTQMTAKTPSAPKKTGGRKKKEA